MVGALIVVGVLFVVVVSMTGQRPFDATSEEDAPDQEEVLTPAGVPGGEETKEGQQPEK